MCMMQRSWTVDSDNMFGRPIYLMLISVNLRKMYKGWRLKSREQEGLRGAAYAWDRLCTFQEIAQRGDKSSSHSKSCKNDNMNAEVLLIRPCSNETHVSPFPFVNECGHITCGPSAIQEALCVWYSPRQDKGNNKTKCLELSRGLKLLELLNCLIANNSFLKTVWKKMQKKLQ